MSLLTFRFRRLAEREPERSGGRAKAKSPAIGGWAAFWLDDQWFSKNAIISR
jgi:hypothetical protein